MENFIKVATDFSMYPGARYKTDGKFSGEEFFEKILVVKFEYALTSGEKLTIDLDGTCGYATSFLSEAFYKLGLKFGAAKVWDNLIIISLEEPYLIDEIKEYIFDAENNN